MISKYVKKPVVVEAIRWMGFNKQIVIPGITELDPYNEK